MSGLEDGEYVKTKDILSAFENNIKAIFEEGELPFLVHLSGGNEDELIEIFKHVQPDDWVLGSHRSHYHYLLKGGHIGHLTDLILNGKSMFIFDKNLNFLTSSILSGVACIAAGIAWQLKQEGSRNHVHCFIGDGAEDNGHFYEAVRFVDGWNLPCTFIIEDNDRSVDTNLEQRRGSLHRTSDSHFRWPPCVYRYKYTPTYPHGGVGTTKWVTFKPEAIERAKANQ